MSGTQELTAEELLRLEQLARQVVRDHRVLIKGDREQPGWLLRCRCSAEMATVRWSQAQWAAAYHQRLVIVHAFEDERAPSPS